MRNYTETAITTARQNVNSALLMMNDLYIEHAFSTAGMPLVDFCELVIVPVLDNIGDRWQKGELSLAQIYMGSRIVERLIEANLKDDESQLKDCGLSIVVFEDFHVLGKRIVSSVVKASGFRLKDYDRQNMEELFAKLIADNTKILLVSTLVLSSALKIKELRKKLNEAGRELIIIVGGAPFRFDSELWREVGADAFSPTATGVIDILKKLTAGDK